MCNCAICNHEITIDEVKNGRKTIETDAPNGGTFLSHRDCVENAVANLAALRGVKANN